MSEKYHIPVMLEESVRALEIDPEGTYVDVTFGGGGHARKILSRLTTGRLFAFDRDADAVEKEKAEKKNIKLTLINHDYRFLKNFLKYHKAIPVQGILADLGISSHQIDKPQRGFSTRFEGPLDMRMNKKQDFDASDLINNYEEQELKRIFSEYGEIRNTNKLVRTLVSARQEKEIKTIQGFKEAIKTCVPSNIESKYLAKVFQSLRIEVNKELDSLKEMLEQSVDVLEKGGRLVVITYHSLEDRLVKNFIRKGNFEGEAQKDFYGNQLLPFKAVNKKPISPTTEEIQTNKRARSAKLRIAVKN